MRRKLAILTFFLSFLLLLPLLTLAEEVYKQARDMAISGKRTEALALLESHLTEHPNDTDARVIYGIVLSWEGKFDEARVQLGQVLAQNPTHGDALPALINVELWSDHVDRAEALAAQGLQNNPNDTTLLLAHAKALKRLDRYPAAIQCLNQLLDKDPANKAARELRGTLIELSRTWETSLGQSYEWLNDGNSIWIETAASIKYRSPAGSLLGRFSRADRFSLSSNQMELDFYPHLRPGTYAYLNVGYSPDAVLYPTYRFGTDLYQSLPHGWEGSAGYRRLGFTEPVNIYTFSIGKYYGNWLFSARTYLTPDLLGVSHSVSFSGRRYFGEKSDYVGFRIGTGASPVEARTVLDVVTLNALGAFGEINRSLASRWTINVRGGYSHEDRLNRLAIKRTMLDLTFYFRF
ncbi:MAG: YaiO family outer membrane beta-barrel protein [Terriglobia bacterium]